MSKKKAPSKGRTKATSAKIGAGGNGDSEHLASVSQAAGTQIEQFIDRNDARIALQESEARLRAIVETAAEGIITVDERGAIESINMAGADMFGCPAIELIGQDLSRLIPVPFGREHAAHEQSSFAGRLRTIGTTNIEGLARHRSGRTFPIMVAVSQVPLGSKELFSAIVHDISARKESEARAIQTQRLAVIGELSAGLAHESRNALQRSQSCLEMLLHEVRDRPKAQELVDRIQKAQDYLLQLYEGVRNYAAPIHLERARIDLTELAQNVWNEIDSIRNRSGARLILRRDEVDSHCFADALRISQVFRNLFENSLAAASDPCEVTVSFADANIDGRPALVTAVHDNGSGIPSDRHHQIFQPFFTTKTRGSGLGLAISKRILEAHGGTIRLDPDAQEGARFEIALPRTRAMEQTG